MKKTRKILTTLFSALFFMLGASVLSFASGIAIIYVAPVMAVLSFVPMPGGVALMAIQKENWIADIVEILFKASPHIQYAYSADSFVLEGKVVHIPNAGSVTAPTRNRSSLPATVIQRTDIDITFNLDEFTTAPVLIKNAEEVELSYDKRQSVMGQNTLALAELIGDWFFYYWSVSTSAQMVRTTGDAILSHTGSATGNRKALTVADIKKAQKLMNRNSVAQNDRYAVLDADMYDQLLGDLTATQSRDFSTHQDVEKGTLGKMYGFTFLDVRATVLVYDNAGTPVAKEPGAGGATTDNAGGLFWQKDSVIRALGTTDFFENIDDPTFYGSIYSALQRAGGRKRRNDGKGVVAIIQTAVA